MRSGFGRRGFDWPIRIGALDDSASVARKRGCKSTRSLRIPGIPAASRDTAHRNDLEKHQCLVLVGSQGRRDIWHLTDRKKSTVAVRIKRRIESKSGRAVARCNDGWLGYIHAFHVARLGRSAHRPAAGCNCTDYPLPDTGIYAVTPQRRMVPRAWRAFVEFLVQHLKNGPPWNEPHNPATPGGKLRIFGASFPNCLLHPASGPFRGQLDPRRPRNGNSCGSFQTLP